MDCNEPVTRRIVATKVGRRARCRGGRFAALVDSATVRLTTDEIMALTRGCTLRYDGLSDPDERKRLYLAGKQAIWLLIGHGRQLFEAAANDGLLAINPCNLRGVLTGLYRHRATGRRTLLRFSPTICAKSLARHCSWQHGNSE